MLNINNNTARIKRDILARIAKLQFKGVLAKEAHHIPRDMKPKNAAPARCCIYHDREIIRMRIIASLGFSLDDYDDEKNLSDYVNEALKREKPQPPMLTVLDDACNSCVHSHYMVTNACQACIARPCTTNCAKKCIKIKNGRAVIDGEACVNCGLCMQNCPYHAIIKIPVPCEEACPVGAISKDENRKEQIDFGKCIFCGNCMRECPFGAMMDRGQIVDVIKHILAGKKVSAMYAPAVAAQFRAMPGQIEGALKSAGFYRVWEVAAGAGAAADKEALEFTERMENGEMMMTTSCCPAYVRAVKLHVPQLSSCVSGTRTPMHYTAEIAKKADPDCVTVFIGPCLAKRQEGLEDEFVDYVLSVEEISAIFSAKEIEVDKMKAVPQELSVTASGRNFGRTGGVANAIRVRLEKPEILKSAVIDGLDKAGVKQLKIYGEIKSGRLPHTSETPNLIEVMTCEHGCIGGPSVIVNPKIAAGRLEKYISAGNSDVN
ncbi:MAG: monomeric [FeFe] hydrogenase [Spirochaetaceae bacterium]|jgi:[FeFe] hydrogenase (group B1/B3)|nr:monomeric [FeFe] hydrogenase [Spirochaetaceae bacterium]